MSLDESEKLSTAVPEKALASTGANTAPSRRKSRPATWPAETGASVDSFATPSEAPAEDEPGSTLSGPEPAVFGGINPGEPGEGRAPDAEEEAREPLGTALEEAVQGNELIPEAPRIDFRRLFRSTPFLLTMMVGLLIGANFLIDATIPTETFVETTVHFGNYDKLNELEIQKLQLEIGNIVRSYPLRTQAVEILLKRSPGVQPGFLNSGLAFYRLDSIHWDDKGSLRLRIESEDPSNDVARLAAAAESFFVQVQDRTKDLDALKASLADQRKQQETLLAQDAALKLRIDELFPDADRYMDLKQRIQSLERFLEVQDESNPLRLVARQNLERLSAQISAARALSLQRDDLLAARMNTQKAAEQVLSEMAKLQRAIDVFAFADAPDPKALHIFDTRPYQKAILRGTWLAIIGLFGGWIGLFHFLDQREAERYRRERRELLAKQGQSRTARKDRARPDQDTQ